VFNANFWAIQVHVREEHNNKYVLFLSSVSCCAKLLIHALTTYILHFFFYLFSSGSTFAAKTSHHEIVSFLNYDKQFECNGRNLKWFFPNGTQISTSNKFQIENPSENKSVLVVKQINAMITGIYKCVSLTDDIEEHFNLNVHCE
jgi:hypothetical protein